MVNISDGLSSNNEHGLSDGEMFILNIFKEFNCDSGHAFPERPYMAKLARLNPKQKNEQEFAFVSLKEKGFIEEKNGKYFLTTKGRDFIY